MIHKILKGLAPVAALAASAMLAGCNVDINVGDGKGVPLAELDQSGEAPSEIVLAGPDTVIVAKGDDFSIAVTGDDEAVEALRFHRDGSSLSVSRDKDSGNNIGSATVQVTVPSLTAMVLAGSGKMEAAELTGNADVTIAGSGKVTVAEIAAESLDLTVAGSGSIEGAGTADSLEVTVAGSGSGDLAGLKVERAEITIAGSGDIEFASDGEVEASIMGSGDVKVNGSATCTVSAMGSGKLRCSTVVTD